MEQTVRIERYADQGRCVAHIDGRVVFVRFALPGELVTITLDEPCNRDDRFWTGEVTEVLEPSADRVEPAWPLAGPLAMGGGVGGADLVHVSLEGQRRWKSASVTEQMKRLGHIDVDVPVAALEGDAERGGLGWRTRIEMIADDEGHPSMRRRGSHVRVPVETMPLATSTLLDVAEHAGVWRGGFEPGAQIRIAAPEPRGAQQSDENYAVLVNGTLVAGRDLLEERATVCGTEFTYQVAASGFWQMHRQAPLTLPQYVIEQVQQHLDGANHAVLWDLYSGSGLFTLPLATLCTKQAQVLSIEGAREAVANARKNLEAAQLDTVDARAGDVAATLKSVTGTLAKPDVVVLDPPRAGARANVCRQIAASGAHTVVYIACDPASLARDTATLMESGYQLVSIQAFDMYPMTHHVETVGVFTR